MLALAELRGTLPEEAIALGLQPAIIEMSTELSGAVSGGLDALVDDIVGQLTSWGHDCTRRAGACADARASVAVS